MKMALLIMLKMLNKPIDIKKKEAIDLALRKLVGYVIEKRLEQNSQFAECSIQPRNGQGIMGQEQISTHPIRMDDIKEEVQDPLIEINLGTKEDPRVTFVSGHLGPEEFNKITMILKEYKDCFAWDYPELPGLSSKLVEHRLPIKEGFQPFQQTPRRMTPDITLKIKEKIERLVRAGFIRPAMYVKWLSNIVPVLKKNSKLRICIDFRNINMATPKDEYPMPIADLLVDGASGYKILSFMDEHSGYNQIFIAESDVHKTAFRCPGSVGTFEWVVMPFGLKNAGATYQRAMNSIFHDMIGKYMEGYIDDIVVKSQDFNDHLKNLGKAFIRMRKHQLKMNPLALSMNSLKLQTLLGAFGFPKLKFSLE
jgi:hypothetical protein